MATSKTVKYNASKNLWCLYWNIDIKKTITSKPNYVKPGDRYYDFEEEQWKIK